MPAGFFQSPPYPLNAVLTRLPMLTRLPQGLSLGFSCNTLGKKIMDL
jgi:hypothetical protein